MHQRWGYNRKEVKEGVTTNMFVEKAQLQLSLTVSIQARSRRRLMHYEGEERAEVEAYTHVTAHSARCRRERVETG